VSNEGSEQPPVGEASPGSSGPPLEPDLRWLDDLFPSGQAPSVAPCAPPETSPQRATTTEEEAENPALEGELRELILLGLRLNLEPDGRRLEDALRAGRPTAPAWMVRAVADGLHVTEDPQRETFGPPPSSPWSGGSTPDFEASVMLDLADDGSLPMWSGDAGAGGEHIFDD
jgi:hypothetical protein